MSKFIEAIRRLSRPKPEYPPPQEREGFSVTFYDLRDPEKTRNTDVEPGYYLAVCPILPFDMENEDILMVLSPDLMGVIAEHVPLPRSDTRIYIDNSGKKYIDPSAAWMLQVSGYIKDWQLLVVRAERVDPDQAQAATVAALRPGGKGIFIHENE